MAGPRYYHKDGKLYDAGVAIDDATAERILKTYPEKIKANLANSADFAPAKKAAELSNQLLEKDLSEVRQALVDRNTFKSLKK